MKKWSALFFLLAACFAAAAVWIAACCPGEMPVLLYAPPEAVQTAQDVMDSLCRGDFDAAEEKLYGHPELDSGDSWSDSVSAQFWDAYVSSLDYMLVGDCYASEDGLTQDVKIIHMELDSVTEHLAERSQALLKQGVENAEDVSQIYDENNEYREDFVAKVMEEAARQALEEDARYGYQIVPLHLIFDRGQWYVMPTRELMTAISGGTMQ